MGIRTFDNSDNNNSNNNNTGSTPAATPTHTASQVAKINLPKGLIDMHSGNYRPVLFRDTETTNLVTVLSKKDKPNALLIGHAGAGKTAVARNLAKLIDDQDPVLPDRIKAMHLYELSLNAIGAGNKYVGETESAIQEVIDFATDPNNHAIIFIDEVHQLFENRDEQLSKLSQALKPAMARDNFHFIGATTTGESKTVLKDPAISRRIEEVKLHNLSMIETKKIILNALPSYRSFHNVIIDDKLAEDIVKLADQNYLQTARPDNALTLIDQASAFQSVQFHQSAALLPTNASISLPDSVRTVSKDTLIETINRHTGNISNTSPRNLSSALLKRVKGQDESIKDIAKRITLFRSNILPSRSPLSFFLAGPTGNGKTETAKSIAKTLFNDEKRLTTINMTEYSEKSSINQLIGSPDGYVGSDSKRATPFDSIYENPSQILLLDEFEKADKAIHHLFYQILEEGYIEDRRGRHIDFSKSILIFTSNANTDDRPSVGFSYQGNSSSSQDESKLIKSLSASIPDALLNRMTKIYKYNSISKDHYKEILRLVFDQMVDQIKENRPDMQLDPADLPDDMLTQWAEESYNKDLNGRPAKKFVRSKIERATLDAILNNSTTIKIQ